MSLETCFERFQRILKKRKSENSRFSLFRQVSFRVVADHIIFLLRNHVIFRNAVGVIYDSGPFYFFSLLWFFLQFWRFGFFFDLTRLRTRLNIFFRRSRFFFQKNIYINPRALMAYSENISLTFGFGLWFDLNSADRSPWLTKDWSSSDTRYIDRPVVWLSPRFEN